MGVRYRKGSQQLDAIEPWHDDVGDHQLYRRGAGLDELQCFRPVSRLMDGEAVLSKNSGRVASNPILVIHNEQVRHVFAERRGETGSEIRSGYIRRRSVPHELAISRYDKKCGARAFAENEHPRRRVSGGQSDGLQKFTGVEALKIADGCGECQADDREDGPDRRPASCA
jgi:hypothetical protein